MRSQNRALDRETRSVGGQGSEGRSRFRSTIVLACGTVCRFRHGAGGWGGGIGVITCVSTILSIHAKKLFALVKVMIQAVFDDHQRHELPGAQ